MFLRISQALSPFYADGAITRIGLIGLGVIAFIGCAYWLSPKLEPLWHWLHDYVVQNDR